MNETLLFPRPYAEEIQCDGPSLTIDHITFDEVPPLVVTNINNWNLFNLSYNFVHTLPEGSFANLSVRWDLYETIMAR